jgi:UDP-glucose 4-epimerase
MKHILVTGGAGYIGSHMCKLLETNGFNVICFDNLSTGFKKLAKYGTLIKGDLLNCDDIENIFKTYEIEAVFHFAAFAYVGESVLDPKKYYQNNVIGSINLFNTMLKYNVKKIVFSSTCATYGTAKYIPIDEQHPQYPINPYGQTKLMIEKVLLDYDKAYGLKSVILRYFNVAGASFDESVGEMHSPEPHLIPNLLDVAIGKKEYAQIFGDDYNTKDGTCVRDYIHVEDLVLAHLKALYYLKEKNQSQIFNLGNGQGYSILEIVKTIEKITQKELPYKIEARREGDPDILISNYEKAKKELNWTPKYGIEEIISSALAWHKKLKADM